MFSLVGSTRPHKNEKQGASALKGSERLILGRGSESFQGRVLKEQEGKTPKELTSAFLLYSYITSTVACGSVQVENSWKKGREKQKQRWRCTDVTRAATVLADEPFVSSPATTINTDDSWEMLRFT